jgi:hypothetical protein
MSKTKLQPNSLQANSRQANSRRIGWISFLLWGGFLGSFGSSISSAAWARPMLNDTSHFLVAQQVVDGLPPPPPNAYSQDALGGQSGAQQYLVVINGDSEALLAQVQQIQPSASLQEYNGQRFIQAGMFSDSAIAQQQVSSLAASGIGAQVVPVVSTSASLVSQAPTEMPGYDNSGMNSEMNVLPPPEMLPNTAVPSSPMEVEFGAPSEPSPATQPSERQAPGSGRSYFVVIPGRGSDIEAISTQVARLTDGMGIDGMVQAGTSRGSHIRVGPFNSRSAATRWTRYFRDFGMDARVNYGR